jgi:hypothetical protein
MISKLLRNIVRRRPTLPSLNGHPQTAHDGMSKTLMKLAGLRPVQGRA